jgi:hypothetical protein
MISSIGGASVRFLNVMIAPGRAATAAPFERQVGSHCQRRTLPAGRIFEPAQLDDAARRRITQRIQVWQSEMMHAAVHTINDGVNGFFQLVIETAGN